MSAITIDATASSSATHHGSFPVQPFPLSTPGGGNPLGESEQPFPLSFTAHDQTAAFQRCWIIYLLTHRGSGLRYVGLTCRALEDRLRAHTYQAGRIRSVRPGGLMEALRFALANGQTLSEAFCVEVIGTATSRQAAVELERRWIADLGCRKPAGLNDMPGGGIGGRAGAVDLVIALPDATVLHHESINEAILTRNDQLREAGQATLKPGSIYARLALGWSPSEALGYSQHEDGRGARDPLAIQGRFVGSLRAASHVLKIGASALRSRLHRRSQSGSDAELGHDMRRAEKDHTPRRSAALRLRLPGSPEPLTASAYAERTGIPKSTVLHRWHAAVRAGFDPARMSPVALLRRLTTGQDRRCLVTLRLPDGRHWSGGERELIRRMLSEPGLEASRARRLSDSGIRRRLRLLTDHDRHDPARVADAFGFDLSVGERS